MKRPGRALVLSVVVFAIAAFGITDLNAICGAPGILTASNFGG
jgi:hypothetical protein